jgi:O-succinylbenzoate synthase
MQLSYAPYTLTAKHSLGRHQQGSPEREGALIRIANKHDVFGYADLHPWTELGDPSLAEQLQLLRNFRPHELAQRSLALALLDANARTAGLNLLENAVLPPSHALVTDFLQDSSGFGELLRLEAEGFTRFKFKLGRDFGAEAKRLNDWSAIAHSSSLLRLDFNSSLAPGQFLNFWRALSEQTQARVEFIEDPEPWSAPAWAEVFGQLDKKEKSPSFALDRLSTSQLQELESQVSKVGTEPSSKSVSFQFMILKPAVQDPGRLVDLAAKTNSRLIVTSYLDHPVGQMGAAYLASTVLSRTQPPETCGLLSHFAYERTDFSEQISSQGPQLFSTEGTGVGFDQLLEEQPWQELL